MKMKKVLIGCKEYEFQYIEEFSGSYGITKNGEVISFKHSKPKLIKKRIALMGWYGGTYCVTLRLNSKPCIRSVAVLVATTFIDNPEYLNKVRFLDGDISNLHVDNLEWCGESAKHVTYYQHCFLLEEMNMDEEEIDKLNKYEAIKIISDFKRKTNRI